VSRSAGEQPLLTFETVRQLSAFPGFRHTVSEQDLRDYRTATGCEDQGEALPAGYAAILGRLGYLHEHRMPPGGVLLGQEIAWLRPARSREPLDVTAVVQSATEDAGGRRKVVIVTTVRQSGDEVARVRVTVGWPT